MRFHDRCANALAGGLRTSMRLTIVLPFTQFGCFLFMYVHNMMKKILLLPLHKVIPLIEKNSIQVSSLLLKGEWCRKGPPPSLRIMEKLKFSK